MCLQDKASPLLNLPNISLQRTICSFILFYKYILLLYALRVINTMQAYLLLPLQTAVSMKKEESWEVASFPPKAKIFGQQCVF